MDASVAGEVLAALGGMASTTRTVVEAIKAVKGHVKNAEAAAQLQAATVELHSLQTQFLPTEEKIRGLNRELFRLEEENSGLRRQETDLRAQISRKEEWASERRKYQHKKFGDSVVLVREDEPDIYYCPTCAETSQKAIPIQKYPHPTRSFGSHYCFTCETAFLLPG